MEIRPERATEVVSISELTTFAFKGTPHGSGTEAEIVERLRDARALTTSLVAIEDGQLVGHVACSPVSIKPDRERWYGLGPVSVRPDRQLLGIGKFLISAALDDLRRLGAAGCVLLGDPAYYGRLGFVSDPGLTYRGRSSRYFQHIVLAGPPAVGDVSFHSAFEG